MRALYNFWYRYGTPPWVGEARHDLVVLVNNGTLAPCKAIDLGCGEGDNAVFLAQNGFDVTAVDFAPAAIDKARAKARAARVDVRFFVDDLTELHHVQGPFDLLVDYGTFDDLSETQRASYLRNVLPLAAPGAKFLLWNFEWELKGWERAAVTLLPFGGMALAPGYVEATFSRDFSIERVAGESGLKGWPRGWAAYLMTRNA